MPCLQFRLLIIDASEPISGPTYEKKQARSAGIKINHVIMIAILKVSLNVDAALKHKISLGLEIEPGTSDPR